MRQRLSWDKDKTAQIEKKADPYTMNQDRRNPPVQKYQTGDPSTWAEDPHMATPWKTEGRTETGHPAPQREAVVTARKLEDKAMKCITVAQRMLPGASDEDIENQATDLMFMPENSILSTLQRQASVAEAIAKSAGDDNDEEDEEEEAGKKDKEDKEKEAGKKKEEDTPEKEKEAGKKKEEDTPEEEKEAGKKKEEDTPEEEKKAGKKDKEKEEDISEEEKEAGKKEEDTPEEEKKEAGKKEEENSEEEKEADKKEEENSKEEKEASGDLLDQIFENELNENKTGAKKLSGIVKKASGNSNSLDNIWASAPDVSNVFER